MLFPNYSRSQERVDRNTLSPTSSALVPIPARKSGWIEIIARVSGKDMLIPARKSGWIEILDRNIRRIYLIPARKSGWIEIIIEKMLL